MTIHQWKGFIFTWLGMKRILSSDQNEKDFEYRWKGIRCWNEKVLFFEHMKKRKGKENYFDQPKKSRNTFLQEKPFLWK